VDTAAPVENVDNPADGGVVNRERLGGGVAHVPHRRLENATRFPQCPQARRLRFDFCI